MLRLIGTLARVAFGFALASIAAGLVTVLFVNTPADVLAEPASRLPQTVSETFDLALLTATHAALFAAVFVLLVAGLGEWFSIRSLPFYLIGGMAIALLGFTAQLSSEVAGQPTILNNYAVKAFLTSGFFAGFVYWLAAGQFAGRLPEPEVGPSSPRVTVPPTGEKPASLPKVLAKAGESQPSVVIESPSEVRTSHNRLPMNRLDFTKRGPVEPEANETATAEVGDKGSVHVNQPVPAESPKASERDPLDRDDA